MLSAFLDRLLSIVFVSILAFTTKSYSAETLSPDQEIIAKEEVAEITIYDVVKETPPLKSSDTKAPQTNTQIEFGLGPLLDGFWQKAQNVVRNRIESKEFAKNNNSNDIQVERRWLESLDEYLSTRPNIPLTSAIKNDFYELVESLRKPGDPPLRIVLHPSLSGRSVVMRQGHDNRFEIHFDLGKLYFARDYNELAGIVSLTLSNIRSLAERRMAWLEMATGGNTEQNFDPNKLKQELDSLKKSQNPNDIVRKRHIQELLSLHELRNTFEKRSKAEADSLRLLKFNINLSDESKRAVLAAKEAVDRMVDGGYDPFSIISPRKREIRETLKGDNFMSWWAYLRNKPTNQRDTLNTELEFLRNYTVYIEEKVKDLQNQVHKGEALPIRLQAIHLMSTGVQSTLGKGFAQKLRIGGVGGVALFLKRREIKNSIDSLMPKASTEASTSIDSNSKSTLDKVFSYTSGTALLAAISLAGIHVVGRTVNPTIRSAEKLMTNLPGRYRDHISKLNDAEKTLSDIKSKENSQYKQVDIEKLLSSLSRAGEFQEDIRSFNPSFEISKNMFYQYFSGISAIDEYFKSHASLEPRNIARKTYVELSKSSNNQENKTPKELAYSELVLNPKAGSKRLKELAPTEFDYWKSFSDWRGSRFSSLVISYPLYLRLNNLVLESLNVWDQALTANPNLCNEFIDKLLNQETLWPNLSKKTQFKIVGLIEKHSPEMSKLLKDGLDKVLNDKDIKNPIKRLFAKTKSYTELSPQEAYSLVKFWAHDARNYKEAAKVLSRHFEAYFNNHSESSMSLAQEVIGLSTRDMGLAPVRWFRSNILFARVMSTLNSSQRKAFWTHVERGGRNPKTSRIIFTPAMRFAHWYYYQGEKDIFSLIEKVDVLRANGARVDWIADYFRSQIERQNIKITAEASDLIIEREFLWKGIANTKDKYVVTDADSAIKEHFIKLSEKYPAFSYDPEHSEFLHKKLTEELNFDALSIDEKISKWESFVSRGVTGFSDQLFRSLWESNLSSQQRDTLATRALRGHLVWDGNLLLNVFKVSMAKAYDPSYLELARNTITDEFTKRILDLEGLFNNKAKLSKEIQNIIKDFKAIIPSIPSHNTQIKNIMHSLARITSKSRIEEFRESLLSAAQNIERAKPLMHKLALIHESKVLADIFSQNSTTLIQALDWVAHKMQLSREDARELENQIQHLESSKGQDLASSVLTAIIEEMSARPREEKWMFIKWLRGKSEAPPVLNKIFQSVGHETVRRFYTAMPIYARQAWIAMLLDSAKAPVLYGLSKAQYNEQILNELLPQGEKSSEVAKDFLEAFLHAVDKVSNPEKRTFVLSYLLASSVDGQQKEGEVLRNVFQAFGVVGVKLGQQFAASDILPEHIRRELTVMRDEASPPTWPEIYKDLERHFGRGGLEKEFKLIKLLGSASLKYAILIEDKFGFRHVITIKKEAAIAPVAKDLTLLEELVRYLSEKHNSKYSFLRGLALATRDAVLRELNLPKEDSRSSNAKAQYESVASEQAIPLEVPDSSDVVKRTQGKRSRFYFMRGSLFAEGTPITEYSIEEQKEIARMVLSIENEIYWNKENENIKGFDPDRHPGNILIEKDKDGKLILHPIDWGQFQPVDRAKKNAAVRLMAFNQILEVSGPTLELTQQLCEDFKIEKTKVHRLQAELASFFPSKSNQNRSSMMGYYYLLSALESQGMQRDVFYYDLLRGLYQLEVYEELLRGEKHKSPKENFAVEVKAAAQELLNKIAKPSLGKKIRYALSFPRAAREAHKNITFKAHGVLEFHKWLNHFELSKDTVKALRNEFAKGTYVSGSELLEFLNIASSLVHQRDREKFSQLLKSIESLPWEMSSLSAEELLNATKNETLKREVAGAYTKNRKSIPSPPLPTVPLVGVMEVYAAEFISSVFWTLYDYDPKHAQHWLSEMLKLEKHVGFAAFAGASTFYNNLVTRKIPMSFFRLRFLSQSGVSAALGMIASSIARKIVEGYSLEEIIDSELTQDNAMIVALASASFMAAEKVVDLVPPLKQREKCMHFLRRLARLSTIFIVAEAIQRPIREKLISENYLGVDSHEIISNEYANFIKLRGNWEDRIDNLITSSNSKDFSDFEMGFIEYNKIDGQAILDKLKKDRLSIKADLLIDLSKLYFGEKYKEVLSNYIESNLNPFISETYRNKILEFEYHDESIMKQMKSTFSQMSALPLTYKHPSDHIKSVKVIQSLNDAWGQMFNLLSKKYFTEDFISSFEKENNGVTQKIYEFTDFAKVVADKINFSLPDNPLKTEKVKEHEEYR